MTSNRIKEIQDETAYPNSVSVMQALLKVWNECEQENNIKYKPQTDSILESVINQFKQRSEVGINKYGTTLDRNDLSTLEWIKEAQQEAMDFCLYLEKLHKELAKNQ